MFDTILEVVYWEFREWTKCFKEVFLYIESKSLCREHYWKVHFVSEFAGFFSVESVCPRYVTNIHVTAVRSVQLHTTTRLKPATADHLG